MAGRHYYLYHMNGKAKEIILTSINLVLIFLWTYAALSKLLNYEQSRMQMMNQVFPGTINKILLWAVPVSELFITGLLLSKKWRTLGLLCSSILLLLFSIYIVVVMSDAFGRIPCSCGGIISELSWGQHLIFNMLFLLLALVGFIITIKKGGYGEGKSRMS